MSASQRSFSYIHIWTLFVLSVAQPLFNLLSRGAEFFIVRNSRPVDVIFMVFLLSMVIPLTLCLVVWIIAKFNARYRTASFFIILTILLTLFVLPGLKRAVDFPGALILLIAVFIGVGVAEGIRRFPLVNTFLTFLAPAILIVPILFLSDSRITKIIKPDRGLFEPVRIESKTPIVFIVFDEFPLVSLIDYDQKIDPVRYPNFARLAQNSIWFRNATTSAAETGYSLTAIITSNYPRPGLLPAVVDYPRNLFTLLSGSYDLNIIENGTNFFPGMVKNKTEGSSFYSRVESLMFDLSAIYLQIVLPDDLSESLPRVSQTWGSFWNQGRLTNTQKVDQSGEPSQIFDAFLSSINRSQKPALYFHHVELPHVPWKYLPSGKEYEYRYFGYFGVDGLTRKERWVGDDWVVARGYQRHLLQVGYVDLLLGRLIERLKQTELFDRCLLIITADHGASFYPGEPRRHVTNTTYQDILPVPLFVKLPNQKTGNTNDDNVETIDLLPTIVDVLDIPVKWKFEGTSLFSQSKRKRKSMYNGSEILRFEPQLVKKYDSVKRKFDLFGSGTTEDRLYKNGPFAGMIDRPIEELAPQSSNTIGIVLNDPEMYDRVDMKSNVLPVFVSGRTTSKTTDPLYLGIAVNGILRAVTRTFPVSEGQGFAALVPETSFHSGKNDIKIFLMKSPEL
jgi:hypothetical protein